MTYVDRETWDEIQRELREGTPDTPERIEIFRRADAIYRRMETAPLEKFLQWVNMHYAPLTAERVTGIVKRYRAWLWEPGP